MTDQYYNKHGKSTREMEVWYKDIVDHAFDLIQCVDSEGNFIYVNQTWLSTLKYVAEDIDHITLWDVIHPDSMEHLKAVLKQVLTSEAIGKVEAVFVAKDGTPVLVEGNVSAKFDVNRRLIHICSIFRDVTECKQMDVSMQKIEAEKKALLDAIPDMMFIFNKDGYFIDYKAEDPSQLLLNPEQFMEKHVTEALPPDLAKLTLDSLAQLFKSNKSKHFKYQLEIAGEQKLLETCLVPCGVFRALAIVRDITECKKYESELKLLSCRDQLTGLYNRYYLGEKVKRIDTEKYLPISIIMADLNGLKLVNDSYGYHTGDEMLERVAEVLTRNCRKDDLIARFGGDEFVLYLPRTPEKIARKISERIEKVCRKELIKGVPLSLSTGLAVKISAEQKLADLLRKAENSMHRDKLTESRSSKNALVSSLLQTLAAISFETEAHTRNMQHAAKKIGEKLDLPPSELHRLWLVITLHDIGKINIPEELLTKKEPLSSAEREIMKKHCEIGFRVAKATENFAHVAEDILAHHEYWDGSGYPHGLKGEEIPLLARITAIVDAYEVMSNGRSYKKAMSISEIVAEFQSCSGTQFDPDLVKLFLSIIEADG